MSAYVLTTTVDVLRISQCQRLKRSLRAAAVWFLPLSRIMMGFLQPSVVVFSWVLDGGGAAGMCSSRQRLPFPLEVQRSVVPPHYATMNINFTANCVGRTFFGRGEPGCFHSFDWRFKFVSYIATIRPRMSSPSLWYRSSKACATA